MLKLVSIIVALTVAGPAFAQNSPHPKKAHQAAPAEVEKPGPASDIAAVPRNVQKWIGGAVDDILTGAGQQSKP